MLTSNSISVTVLPATININTLLCNFANKIAFYSEDTINILMHTHENESF